MPDDDNTPLHHAVVKREQYKVYQQAYRSVLEAGFPLPPISKPIIQTLSKIKYRFDPNGAVDSNLGVYAFHVTDVDEYADFFIRIEVGRTGLFGGVAPTARSRHEITHSNLKAVVNGTLSFMDIIGVSSTSREGAALALLFPQNRVTTTPEQPSSPGHLSPHV